VSAGPLSEMTWDELEQLPARWNAINQLERPRAWRETDRPTDEGLRHVRDYVRGCRALAREFLSSERFAARIHALVCGTDYELTLGVTASTAPAPAGGIASVLSAHLSGASWGVPTATLRHQWYYRRPTSGSF